MMMMMMMMSPPHTIWPTHSPNHLTVNPTQYHQHHTMIQYHITPQSIIHTTHNHKTPHSPIHCEQLNVPVKSWWHPQCCTPQPQDELVALAASAKHHHTVAWGLLLGAHPTTWAPPLEPLGDHLDILIGTWSNAGDPYM